MQGKSFYTNGKDDFKKEFCREEWSAPYLVSYLDIKERMNTFCLIGRRIKDIRAIGISYMHTSDWIEEQAYNILNERGLSEEEVSSGSDYDSIDDNMPMLRYMEIDEPIMFLFEDGDQFEIVTEVEPKYRMSMNKIPRTIDAGINSPNVDAAIIFSPCIGSQIVSVEYNTGIVDEHLEESIEVVKELIIWLSNGMGLLFTTECYDFCHVYLIDENKEIVRMEFKELKKALYE